MATKTKLSDVLLDVEVCGDGGEANDESRGERHPRDV